MKTEVALSGVDRIGQEHAKVGKKWKRHDFGGWLGDN
jgi:hypothetical protein